MFVFRKGTARHCRMPAGPGSSGYIVQCRWVRVGSGLLPHHLVSERRSAGLAVAAITLTVCSHKSDWYCRPSTLSDSSLAGANPSTVLRVGRSSFSFDLAAQPILGQAAEQVPRPLWTGSSACKAIPRCAGSRQLSRQSLQLLRERRLLRGVPRSRPRRTFPAVWGHPAHRATAASRSLDLATFTSGPRRG